MTHHPLALRGLLQAHRSAPLLRHHRRARVPPLAPRAATTNSSAHNQNHHDRPPPWALTFDLRERETEWTDANKARLLALVAARRLSLSAAEVDAALGSLIRLVPGIAPCVHTLHADVLVELLRALPSLPGRLIALRGLFPTIDVGALAAAWPALLLRDVARLEADGARVKALLSGGASPPPPFFAAIDAAVQAQPLLLEPECVEEALAEMARLLPAGADAAALLVGDPGWLPRVQRGQRWLGLNPDSQPGELIEGWVPPATPPAPE